MHKLKLPLHTALKLQQLADRQQLPMSQAKDVLFDLLISEGIIHRHILGRSKSLLSIPDPALLAPWLRNHFGIENLEAYISLQQKQGSGRAEAVAAASDSKIMKARSFKGFLVNCTEPVECTMNGSSFVLNHHPGAFTFIYDYEKFRVPEDVCVIGVENSENFRYPEKQQALFGTLKAVFVSRYPQSKDLVRWLQGISNPFIHFGDLDIAGIHIYLNEYKKHLGDRAAFFVPPQAEEYISRFGSRELYNKQLAMADTLPEALPEPGINEIIGLIHKYKKGLEQESFIG